MTQVGTILEEFCDEILAARRYKTKKVDMRNRYKRILETRILPDKPVATLKELGIEFQVTANRIRQCEVFASRVLTRPQASWEKSDTMTQTSSPSTYCNLKCKYCGRETPLFLVNENTEQNWELAGEEYVLRNFLHEHSSCLLAESQVDRQPFLLSWG